jgi:hypothetical protein
VERSERPKWPPKKEAEPANDQMIKRWGRVIACKDCFHSYMTQLQPLQPLVRVCACQPPLSQIVVTPEGHVIQMVARIVSDTNFCGQFENAMVD